MFPTVTNPVRVEAQSTVMSQVTAKFHPIQTAQEVSKVSEAIHPTTVNQSVTEAVVIVALSEVKEVIVQEVAANHTVVMSHATDKSDSAVTFQLNVVVELTFKVPVETELAEAAHNEALSVVNELVVVELDVTFVIFQVVAVIESAVIAVHVNVQSAVILPVNSILPFTVCKVTLDKSKFIFSMTFSSAMLSREI